MALTGSSTPTPVSVRAATQPDRPLYRVAAVNAKQTQWLGEIVLIRPLSFSLVVAGLAEGSYTKRSAVSGRLIPDTGVIKVYVPQAGIVLEKHVVEGALMTRTKLLTLAMVKTLAAGTRGLAGSAYAENTDNQTNEAAVMANANLSRYRRSPRPSSRPAARPSAPVLRIRMAPCFSRSWSSSIPRAAKSSRPWRRTTSRTRTAMGPATTNRHRTGRRLTLGEPLLVHPICEVRRVGTEPVFALSEPDRN